jgi:selenocysteine lyase/cysteine desulfurase
VALCFKLKAEMGVENMLQREQEMLDRIWQRFNQLPKVHVLADNMHYRLGVLSFYMESLHYNLGVKLLNDRFGIQTRGGCSCAGTYGHYLLEVTPGFSKIITDQISHGDLSNKPGWIRMSIHPTMTDAEIDYIMDAIEMLCNNHPEWAKDYTYNAKTNEFIHKEETETQLVEKWFKEKLS